VHTDELKRPKKDNEGARELRRLYPARGGSAEVARLLDADPSAVSRWFSGERAPDTKMRAALEEKLGVDWRLFDREIELAADDCQDSKEPAA
jgi:transcriptional regulator with XRE-family HTH domain